MLKACLFVFQLAVGAGYAFSSDLANEAQAGEAPGGRDVLFESLRDDTEYEVVLLAGQSNMVGQGNVGDLDAEARQLPRNIEFFNFGRGSDLQFEPSKFGPEVTLAQSLSSHSPDRHFVLIKYAVGASSLLDWSPNWSYGEAEITGHPQFGPLYYNFIKRVRRITGDKDVRFVALLWMQGERDAQVLEAGASYFVNITKFIARLRSDLGAGDLPVLVGQVNPPADRHPALEEVRDAQARVSLSSANVYLIETDGLEKWSDKVHYSTRGQLELGRRFSDVLTRLLASP